MKRRNRRWEERWKREEMREQWRKEGRLSGFLWTFVQQLMWDWFSQTTEDWWPKSKPHHVFSSPDLSIFLYLTPVSPFPSLCPSLSLSPRWSQTPLPSFLLSALITQHNIHTQQPRPVCSHQEVCVHSSIIWWRQDSSAGAKTPNFLSLRLFFFFYLLFDLGLKPELDLRHAALWPVLSCR